MRNFAVSDHPRPTWKELVHLIMKLMEFKKIPIKVLSLSFTEKIKHKVLVFLIAEGPNFVSQIKEFTLENYYFWFEFSSELDNDMQPHK